MMHEIEGARSYALTADSAAAAKVPEGGDMRKRGACIRGSTCSCPHSMAAAEVPEVGDMRKRGASISKRSCPHSMAAAGVTQGMLGMRPWLDGLEQAFLALFSRSLIATITHTAFYWQMCNYALRHVMEDSSLLQRIA